MNKDLLFNIAATLTSKAMYSLDGKQVIYDQEIIKKLLEKINKELEK